MTERQADQAWVEAERAKNLGRADGNALTYQGIPVVWNPEFTWSPRDEALWNALNGRGREHG